MRPQWVACLALLLAHTAQAQIFSPGDLSQPHARLDGVTRCMKCHVGDSRGHSNEKCLECHTEIARRLDQGRGLHDSVRTQKCAECHVEHRGEQARIIDWKGERKAFNHVLTGWPLSGAHKKADCKDCHDPRLVQDDQVRALIQDGRESWLGLSPRCGGCHFDEHRGQEGSACQDCHTPTSPFKEAPRFRHNDPRQSRYALTGLHKKVKCSGCHAEQTDDADLQALVKPRSKAFLKLKDIPSSSCTDCHEDVHLGQLGSDCVRCHSTDGWKIINTAASDTGFHDKHAFQLRGAHTSVSCRACHGPSPGRPARFKGLKFKQCVDCHVDAHVGQLSTEAGVVRCEKCHSQRGFTPVLFTAQMHDTARFALEGSHQAVACDLCHTPDSALLKRAAAGQRQRASDVKLRFNGLDGGGGLSCATCHRDPHQGQFEGAPQDPTQSEGPTTCATCHKATAFSDLSFAHADTRFPLTGKHQQAPCAACHIATPTKGERKSVVPWRGVDRACDTCHADVHVGQLASGERSDCAKCHGTDTFKQPRFNHATQSAFPLTGRHRPVACARCHPSATADGVTLTRYKPVPTTCAGCHHDFHKDARDGFRPAQEATRCEGCHGTDGWTPATFPHERTGFVLTGRHQQAACRACHPSGEARATPTSCAGCHADPHAQEFGTRCGACHTTERFDGPAFSVDAHRRTLFPLAGRHAAIPCEECHVEKRERTFSRAAVDCASCHGADARRASLVTVDHRKAPFSAGSCRACHAPSKFVPARFPQHDTCFPITRGVHAGVQCATCHNAQSLVGARADGDCRGVAVRCAECHTHRSSVELRRHRGVVGFEFKSAKCAGCHRTP